jgi:catechol-2,3-dioxygenase
MPRGLSELVLIVADVPRSAAFYRDVVGLIPETAPTAEWAWFWAGAVGEAQRLAVHKGPLLFEEHSPRPPGARFGNVHFALELEHAEAGAALDRVRRAGVEVHGPVHFQWMNADSWYFYDPDGNLVEFWVPRPRPD